MSLNSVIPTAKYRLALIGLALVILVVGSGFYEADIMPKDEIFISLLTIALFYIGYIQCKSFSPINQKMFLGFAIYNLFFIAHISLLPTNNIEIKTYFIHLISIGSFLASYFIANKVFSAPRIIKSLDNRNTVAVLALLSLGIILSTQLMQIYSNSLNFTFRPSGYLNPNTTAAVSLVLFFIILKSSKHSFLLAKTIALITTITIVLFTQSRAGLIALACYLIYFLTKTANIRTAIVVTLLLTIIFLCALKFTPEYFTLIEAILQRFSGDESSSIRVSLLQKGWEAFINSPVLGNGFRYIEAHYSQSSHNEILEILANFGLVGLLIIGVSFYCLYVPFNLIFFILCISPIFLFSHNFFDTYAYQSILGVALASSRKFCDTPYKR